MSKLVPLGAHIAGALTVLWLHDRHALVYAQAVALESDEFAGVVGDGADRMQPEIEQDLRADTVVAQIGLEAELLVRLDRIGALILQLVRLELVEQTDAP